MISFGQTNTLYGGVPVNIYISNCINSDCLVEVVVFSVSLIERERRICKGRVEILLLHLASYNFDAGVLVVFCIFHLKRMQLT